MDLISSIPPIIVCKDTTLLELLMIFKTSRVKIALITNDNKKDEKIDKKFDVNSD